MPTRRTKGDGGLVHRHDHKTCPPAEIVGTDEDGKPIWERPKHTCQGRWVGTLTAPLPGGGSKRLTFYGRTQAEAKKKLDDARRDKDKGILVASSPTLGVYLTDWLEKRRQPPNPLKPNTWNGYRSKIANYLLPSPLAKKRLTDIKPRQIEDLYDVLRLRGLSEASVRQTHMILQKALKDAVRLELLGVSPMERVRPPGTEVNERDQWTIPQAMQALRAAGDSLRWWLAIFYGMRQGEVLALDWRYVDWEAGTFAVEQSRSNDYGYAGTVMTTPKARASMRELPMLPQIEVRARLLWEERGRPTEGLIFPNSAGKPMDPKRDWQQWRAFIDSATVVPFVPPLPYIALHAARNTAASLMEAADIPDRLVAQILGQATVKTTHAYQKAERARVRAELAKVSALVDLGLAAGEPRSLPAPD